MSEKWITWCSFADNDRCRGILILDGALDPVEACTAAHATGQNPGGSVFSFSVALRDFPESERVAVLDNIGRLITAERARELFDVQPLREFEDEQVNRS